ncbi:hypothetical protein DPV78_004775 [Talaromyces pinophilus]|nr:hypothetical protein DPV78_004775 [Talaromyces pinophilus]
MQSQPLRAENGQSSIAKRTASEEEDAAHKAKRLKSLHGVSTERAVKFPPAIRRVFIEKVATTSQF